MDRISNKDVLNEDRTISIFVKKRRERMLGHIFRQERLLKTVIERLSRGNQGWGIYGTNNG